MQADPLTQTFAALADPTRRAILEQLAAGEKTVLELAQPFDISLPAVSRHLRVLEEAGLVESHEEATRSFYSVRVQGFASVREFLDEFWDTALARLEQLAPGCSAKMSPTVFAIEVHESPPEVTNRLLQKASLSPEQTGQPGTSGRMPQSVRGFSLWNCLTLMPA